MRQISIADRTVGNKVVSSSTRICKAIKEMIPALNNLIIHNKTILIMDKIKIFKH